jgi:hypothetical protein
MALVFPDVGENKSLENIVNKTAPENLVLRLYTSNTTPGESDTAGTYTEASGGGYAAITLTGSSWGAAASGSIAYAQQTFTFSSVPGTATMYGYFMTEATSGVLKYAERFTGAPFTIANAGDQIKITPTITAA